MNIKLAVYTGFTQVITKCGVEKAAEDAKVLDVEAAELLASAGVGSYIFKSVEEARCAREILSLEMPCYSVFADLYNDKEDKMLNDLLYNVTIAKELGARCFHHTIYPPLRFANNPPLYDDVLSVVAPKVIKVAKFAEAQGLIPVYEPQGMYFNGIIGVERLLETVRAECPTAGVLFDSGNSYFGLTHPYDFLEHFLSEVVHVHIKDYEFLSAPPAENEKDVHKLSSGEYMRDCALGAGDARVKDCLALLKKSGYNGAYSCETMVGGTYMDKYLQSQKYIEDLEI